MLSPATRQKIEHAQSGTARAALLGVSDGLVSNVSLILGVAAASTAPDVVRIAGIASLIAGACSMAVGEYISMRGQVELLESVLVEEREELRSDPERAKSELRDIMLADGLDRHTARLAANDIAQNSDKAMAMYARGKLGINPAELGSAWRAAGSSFIMFVLGAAVPLLPWFFSSGTAAIIWSITLAGVAALGIGTYLGWITSGRMIWAALRQLFIVVLAAGITYSVGLIFHITVT